MINDRPTHLRVNLDAVLNNYRKLDKLNGLKTSLAVVKADSYGLGAKVIAPARSHGTSSARIST